MIVILILIQKKIFFYVFMLDFLYRLLDVGLADFFHNRFGAFYTQKNAFVFVFVKKMIKKRFENDKKSKYR